MLTGAVRILTAGPGTSHKHANGIFERIYQHHPALVRGIPTLTPPWTFESVPQWDPGEIIAEYGGRMWQQAWDTLCSAISFRNP